MEDTVTEDSAPCRENVKVEGGRVVIGVSGVGVRLGHYDQIGGRDIGGNRFLGQIRF